MPSGPGLWAQQLGEDMDYNEAKGERPVGALLAGQGLISHRDTTVAENIDNRIAHLQEQIARLQKVKAVLESGNILNVPLEDLNMAMGRY